MMLLSVLRLLSNTFLNSHIVVEDFIIFDRIIERHARGLTNVETHAFCQGGIVPSPKR